MKRTRTERAVSVYGRRDRAGMVSPRSMSRDAGNGTQRGEAADLVCLTAHELRLLQQSARGLSDKQIASESSRSYRTVQTQMRLLRVKLGMRTRFELGYHASRLLRLLGERALMVSDLSGGLHVSLAELMALLAATVNEGAPIHRQRATTARVVRGER